MGSYSWGFHPDAERELEECQTVYGARFRQQVRQWLAAVAIEAAKGHEIAGQSDLDVLSPLQYVTLERLRTWTFAVQMFRNQVFRDQVKAIVLAVRTRSAPYEYWATEKYFPDVASSFDHTVKAFFVVNRVSHRVTFTVFADLPGA